jgi:hypothetical protein
MNPELNQEYPEPGEDALIHKMVELAVERMKDHDPRLRGQHAKSTGCVRAMFTIRDDVPSDLRHGVFSEPNKTFQAIVRFSNSQEMKKDDSEGTARGMAVKLLDVDGPPAIPDTGERCQDFLMINHPVFPFATPREYVEFSKIRSEAGGIVGAIAGAFVDDKTSGRAGDNVGDKVAGLGLGLRHPHHLAIIKAIREQVVASPLELRYWSGSPYWLGPPGNTSGRAVKYSVLPHCKGSEPPSDPDENYLSQALARHLKTKEAVFDFRIQRQTDPVAMPVEDVSVKWDEDASEPIPLATLSIGVQDVEPPDGPLSKQCEAMAFSPWNALVQHRPMGGINRLRKAVYLASHATRKRANLARV